MSKFLDSINEAMGSGWVKTKSGWDKKYPITQEIADGLDELKAEGRRIVNSMFEKGVLSETLNSSSEGTPVKSLKNPTKYGDTIRLRKGGGEPIQAQVVVRNGMGRSMKFPISALKMRSYTERFQRFIDKYHKELS